MSEAQRQAGDEKREAPASQPAPANAADKGFSSASVVSIPLPRVFGRLLLLKLLARGGMGDVYLAATTGIEGAERPIVVKTVRRDHIHDGSFLARFLDEARVQSQLNHPGVAQILEASTDENGEPYTVVEYVEGRSLADLRHRAVQVGARIGWPEAAAIAIEMGQALAHVHERAGADGTPLGIVHRDLSPQNVMIGHAGEVKLIDFGTARGHNRRCHTVAGVVFAKPGYVAPEVARQQVGDGRIDIYAMGVMLWELCAGKRLLSGEAQKHLEEVAANKFEIPLLAPTRGIPRELDVIIAKLCSNDPDERYANASVAATDLARVLAQAPAGKSGERSTRARISALMKTLWPHEPARSRAEFAKILKQARELRRENETPPASGVMEIHAAQMTADPTILGGTPYRLLKKIGEGASGEVFEAEHMELGRKYAVKVLSAAHAAAHDAVERFRREARAVAKLSHPNLVQLHDFGKSIDGRVFLAMELLDGHTLDIEAEKGLGWRSATRLAIQATRALEAAHDAGLVHRDLKPQNLFLTSEGELKLLDFGVAMALAETAGGGAPEKRQKGFAVFGTPEYMAPEQVAGEAVDARCDVYALGCVLYELVTGARPFEGSAVVVMGKQLREEPEHPRTRAPHAVIPGELEAVILKALAKSKDARYESARAMREALEEALRAPDRRRKRARAFAAVAVMASIGLIAVAGLKDKLHRTVTAMTSKPSVTTLAVADLPSQPPAAAEAPEVAAPPIVAVAAAAADPVPAPPVTAESAPEAPKAEPVAANAPVLVPVKDRDDDARRDAKPSRKHDQAAAPAVVAEAPAKEPGNGLLVRASARQSEDPKARLADARANARDRSTDPKALKAWAIAAMNAGETREARRAAEAWAVHDGSAEPRLFLAAALEAAGRRREARGALEEWLSNHPDSAEAKRMLSRLGANPEPAIKRNSRSRSGRSGQHQADPAADE
ncbi:Serine/threonine-protein kinase PknB [Labilithrix luteola]|uniref:Serine/threonine-protein kinase PknB n=1 Tax=Labilithrix luteola TaxID=1391654 RepID=A0A0K1QGH0_9BACT|nr:serine/threonine-protein kinase [Labilithrix luteola]AKV04818.1 Serine/threonine-protein kinase PknB [Labilithrix luteola]